MNYCGQPRLLCHIKDAAEIADTARGSCITSQARELVLKRVEGDCPFTSLRLNWVLSKRFGFRYEHSTFCQPPLRSHSMVAMAPSACATHPASIYQSKFTKKRKCSNFLQLTRGWSVKELVSLLRPVSRH